MLTRSWKKSTRSGGNGNCVEVRLDGVVEVRDTKDREGPVLRFTTGDWVTFVKDLPQK